MTDGSAQPWGATPEDWKHFERLGLTADLLPVVGNPRAVISEASKLRDLGKTPSRYDRQGKVVGVPQWTAHHATAREVQRWAAERDLGICLQTRRVRALDIDIADVACAGAVRDLVALCQALPVRWREGSGKCLLAFTMPGEFTKRIIRTEHGLIEFLANGQQFIAVSTHPSGARYQWADADGVLGLPGEFPELSPAEFEVLWSALADAFALPDGVLEARRGLMPVTPRRSGDLNDPTVAWLDENGWVREYARDGRVDVRCPWEDGHSTDTGPSSTSYFPAGVGGFAQGHFRCLHASCTGRTDGDFFEAVGYSAADFAVVEAGEGGEQGGLAQPLPAFTRDRSGRVEAEIGNVAAALRRPDVCGVHIGRDQFTDGLMVAPYVPDGRGVSGWRSYTDEDHTRLRIHLAERGFKPVSAEMMGHAVDLVGAEHAFDSAQLWLNSLPAWDGVERCASFMTRYMGAEPGPYADAVGAYLWTALAGRVLDPGCQADMALVWLGAQGAGKTRAVKALVPAPEHYVEINLAHRDDNLSRSLRGKLVGELGELRGLASREAEDIKAWISRGWEEWVRKYKEFTTKFPRRLVFVGTSNEDQFLTDPTGNRRWLPIPVGVAGAVDVAAIERDREQLWAEGAAWWRAEGVAWREAERLARDVHAAHTATDAWADAVNDWLDAEDIDGVTPRSRDFLRMGDVLHGALKIEARGVGMREEKRVGKILRALGYQNKQKKVCGQVQWVWKSPLR